jgi:hypothetical protein
VCFDFCLVLLAPPPTKQLTFYKDDELRHGKPRDFAFGDVFDPSPYDVVEGRVRRLGDDEGVRPLKKDKTPKVPTIKAKKTKAPTGIPSRSPSLEPTETFEPSSDPSAEPSISVMPSAFPSDEPSISLEPSTTFAPTSSKKKKKSSKSGKGKGKGGSVKVVSGKGGGSGNGMRVDNFFGN